jgi:hypothetical protein
MHYEKELPKTISRCLTALNELIRVNFRIVENSTDNKEIISASSLIATLLDKYIDLTTNEQLVKGSIDYINSIREEAQQIKQQYEQRAISSSSSSTSGEDQSPQPKFGNVPAEFVGNATS